MIDRKRLRELAGALRQDAEHLRHYKAERVDVREQIAQHIDEAANALEAQPDDALTAAVQALREIQRITDMADAGIGRQANGIAMRAIAAIAERTREQG